MTRAIWFLFLALLVLLPLPFGGFRPWAWSVAGLVAGLLVLGWSVLVMRGRMPLFWRSSLAVPLAACLIVLCWMLVQILVPAGSGIGHPLWALAAETLGSDLAMPISVDPANGWVAIIRYLTPAACFWIALQFCRDRARAITLLRTVALAGTAYAAYGLINWVAGNELLLWYPRWAYLDDVTSTFVNRNSYATFAGLGLVALLVMTVRESQRKWHEADPTANWLDRRVVALSGAPAWLAASGLVVAMALLQSHSRMGMIAALAGIAATLALMLATRQIRGWIPLAAIAAAGLLVFFSSADGTITRLADGGEQGRIEIFRITAEAIGTAPLTGFGAGSYGNAIHMFRGADLAAPGDIGMAHNSYLEAMFDLGIPAALLLFTALAWPFGIALLGSIRRRRDKLVPIAGVGACVVVGVHSLLDFSFQIPAVACTMCALLGAAVALSYRSDPRLSEPRQTESVSAEPEKATVASNEYEIFAAQHIN